MSSESRFKALVVKFGTSEYPWWWQDIDHAALDCELHYKLIPLEGGVPTSPATKEFLILTIQAIRTLFQARRDGYRYIVTIENDWLTFIFASLQTLLMFRTPRHVILQFVMRERTPALMSKLKYAFMRWSLSSVHLCACASKSEIDHYASTFRWQRDKLAFVPSPTRPEYLGCPDVREEPFILSAGRTFRDYPTLLNAVADTELNLTIVAGHGGLSQESVPPNVTVHYDLTLAELNHMMARCMMVVVPLEPRQISAGQSVLLDAMAMGKPVVVTRVAGTVDYVEHMETALVVAPNDPREMQKAIEQLASDAALRRRLGDAGRELVKARYLPDHYARGLARALRRLP